MKRTLLFIVLVLVVSFGAYACKPKTDIKDVKAKSKKTDVSNGKNNTNSNKNDHDNNPGDSASNFNPFNGGNMPANVKSAYAFAKNNQDLLKKFYCVCGCMGAMHEPRHKNLAQCFIDNIDSKGNITYDSHGSTCKACLDEAIDIKIWTEKGFKFSDMVKEYQSKYGKQPGAPSKWDFK